MNEIKKTFFNRKPNNSIDKYLALSNKQSLSVGIYYKGKLYYYNNDERTDCKYDLGSITKTMTAHLVLYLSNKNLIDLNKTVDNYIKLKKGNYPTILQLLTHSCNFNHFTPFEIVFFNLLFKSYSKANLYRNCDNNTVVKMLEKRRYHNYNKEHKYSYSDFNFAILALVCSVVTKTNFNELFSDFINKKLNLKESSIQVSNRYPKAIIKGKETNFWIWENNNPYIAAGGLTTTIFDMLNYLKIQIESNEPYIYEAHKPIKYAKNSNIGICYGWHTYKKSNQLWHVGGVGTFRSSIIINKVSKIGVVVLGNSVGVLSGNVHYIAKAIYSEIKMKRILK